MAPGMIDTTLMGSSMSSRRSVSLMHRTACLVAPYTPDAGLSDATDEMLTMKPSDPHARMACTAACDPTSRASTLVSSMTRQCSGSASTIFSG